MGETRRITDHDEIRRWAEAHGAIPALGPDPTQDGGGADVLGFDFDTRAERLDEIDWLTFFETFEDNQLALLAQDEIDGSGGNAFQFVER